MKLIILYIIFLEILQILITNTQEPPPLTTTTESASTTTLSSSLVNSSSDLECKYHRKKCPFDVDMRIDEELNDSQLNSLFPGLFHNVSSFQNIMLSLGSGEMGTLINFTKVRNSRRRLNIERRGKRNGVCCQTNHQAIIPLTVAYNDKEYKVKHAKDNYQIVYTGFCSDEDDTTPPGGPTCRTTDIYHWILIEDLELSYEPPVKFIPVMFKGFCSCLNIG